jgi:hypothetical protein
MIGNIFPDFFEKYKTATGKSALRYVVTSSDRPGDPAGSPHRETGNALDITLRLRGEYAPISEYNELFAYMMDNWNYRAGIDNTWGNIHIHIDLGRVFPKGQVMPYFFKEDNQKWICQIKNKNQITEA